MILQILRSLVEKKIFRGQLRALAVHNHNGISRKLTIKFSLFFLLLKSVTNYEIIHYNPVIKKLIVIQNGDYK